MNTVNVYICIDKVEFHIYEIKNKVKMDILKDKIIIPKSFDMGDKLKYLRKFISAIIQVYDIEKGSIEVEDAIGMDIIIIVKMEAIIEELFTDCGVVLCK